MSKLSLLFLLLATLGSGMMAGLFCSFSSFIMKALSSISFSAGIAAMQAINRVIVRPVFLMVFLGTGVTCVLALITGWQDLGHRSRIWGISGAIVYLLGSVGVTIAFNVPLNNRLDRVDADSEQGASMWETYFVRWTRWNHVRSIATIASTALLILAVYYAN